MKKTYLSLLAVMLSAIIFPLAMSATEIEPSLKPLYTHPSKDRPFVMPLEEVGFIFDRCIKTFDDIQVSIKCYGEVVATPVSYDVDNYDGELGMQGTLIAKFDKQNLPKGKKYTVELAKGSVGWVKMYNDIQIVNMRYSFDFEVPDNLGVAHSELKDDSSVVDSDNYALGFYYGYEVKPVGTPEFLFYKNNELIDKLPVEVSNDWDLGNVKPDFKEKTNFEFGARYKLVLPAGSVSSAYRDDIVNEEYALSFIGAYKDPDEPVSYTWCNLFTEHSNVLNEVRFTYQIPVDVTPGAVIELYEGDQCEKLVKTAPAYLNTDVNCFMVECNFGGFVMEDGKGYVIVVPEGAVYATTSDTPIAGGKLNVSGSSAVTDINAEQNVDEPMYDLMGRRVQRPVAGSVYIRGGKKIICR